MPNWCSNRVTVRGSLEQFNEFREYVGNGKTIDFEKILPMPDELKGVMSPTMIVENEQEVLEYMQARIEEGYQGGRPITQEVSDRYCKLYGADNWLDWATDNWGTKWNINQEDQEFGLYDLTDRNRQMVFSFLTAWGPPKPIFEHLVEKFRNLEIEWYYDVSGEREVGYLNQRRPINA